MWSEGKDWKFMMQFDRHRSLGQTRKAFQNKGKMSFLQALDTAVGIILSVCMNNSTMHTNEYEMGDNRNYGGGGYIIQLINRYLYFTVIGLLLMLQVNVFEHLFPLKC